MTPGEEFGGRVGFAIGTGRSGTHFAQTVLAKERGVASSHARNRDTAAFHRYCCWYGLPIDHAGFLAMKEAEIRADLAGAGAAFSFEASSFLVLSVEELFQRFGARFILVVRRPEDVVNSFWSKGWYNHPYVQDDPHRALGFQNLGSFYYNFSRLAPRGDSFTRWNQMTRVGKIAWYWSAMNLAAWEQFQRLPQTHWRVAKLEELTFPRYHDLAEFLGIRSALTEADYQRIVTSKPGRAPRRIRVDDWSADEIEDFESQVQPAAERFGYEYRVARLPKSASHREPKAPPAWLEWSLRRARRAVELARNWR